LGWRSWQAITGVTVLEIQGYTSYGTLCAANWAFFAFTLPSGIRGKIANVRFRAQGYGATLSNPTGNSSYETGPFRNWAANDFGASVNMVVRAYSAPYPIQNSGALLSTSPDVSIPFSTMNAANAAAGHVFSIQNNSLIPPPVTELTNFIDASALENTLNGLSSDSFLLYTCIPWPSGNFPYLAGPASNCANDFQELLSFNYPQLLLST